MMKNMTNRLAGSILLLLALLISGTAHSQIANQGEADLLNLRDNLAAATTVKAKKDLLKQIGHTGTFVAMNVLANYLPDQQLGKTAAEGIYEIAMANKDLNGSITRSLLAKAALQLSGGKRNAIIARLAEAGTEEGFVSLFNGKDLSGWKGLVENPIARAKMSAIELAEKQFDADQRMREDWKVENGLLVYVGHGYDNICTQEQYGDFEMLVDWRLDPNGEEPDAGIYLRGTPQVQIWDIARTNVGAQVGSGGLYNNQKNKSIPLCVADKKLGEWNSFYIRMVGDKVTVRLNGVLVVDNVTLENYWDRSLPIFPVEQLELQAHGSKVYYRDIYVRRLDK